MAVPAAWALKLISPGVRRLTIAIAVLAFVVGPLLFLLPDKTDTLFAWTINPPLTAAFLGGGYCTALVIELLSARERIWARARIVYPAVLLFTTLTLLATLLHMDRFHFNSPGLAAKGTAYAWFVIYVLAPPVMLILLVYQLRQPGGDPPRRALLPPWFRAVIAGQAACMIGLGAALFVAPQQTAGLWPWMLTPLTAQVVGAWLVGLGVALAHGAWENSWERAWIAMVGAVVAGGLQLLSLLRFAGAVQWGAVNTWVYALFLFSLVGVGAYGWYAARQATAQPEGRSVAGDVSLAS